jgi:hypothetical protein
MAQASSMLVRDGLAPVYIFHILPCTRSPRAHLSGERPVRTSHPDGVFVSGLF